MTGDNSSRINSDSLDDLRSAVRKFRDERDWSHFHTPKNFAAAITIETSELQECFLWKDDAETESFLKDPEKRSAVEEEIADILLFALLLSDRLKIDVGKAILKKLQANAEKYPVQLARGNARKYTELTDQ